MSDRKRPSTHQQEHTKFPTTSGPLVAAHILRPSGLEHWVGHNPDLPIFSITARPCRMTRLNQHGHAISKPMPLLTFDAVHTSSRCQLGHDIHVPSLAVTVKPLSRTKSEPLVDDGPQRPQFCEHLGLDSPTQSRARTRTHQQCSGRRNQMFNQRGMPQRDRTGVLCR